MSSNYDRFLEVYRVNLERAVTEHPADYCYPLEQVPVVFDRMRDAIEHGSFNKDSHAFKWACKELGIRHTYKAINEFIKGE